MDIVATPAETLVWTTSSDNYRAALTLIGPPTQRYKDPISGAALPHRPGRYQLLVTDLQGRAHLVKIEGGIPTPFNRSRNPTVEVVYEVAE